MTARAASLPPSIPLDEAMLCLTCELVFAGTVCPRCADRFHWPLAVWLARPETAAERDHAAERGKAA